MPAAPSLEFVAPADWSRTRLRRHLAERLNIHAEGVERRIVFHDTFDWLLHRAGWSLEHVPGGEPLVRLISIADGCVVEQRLDAPPAPFAQDWPRGPVKIIIAPITDVRALLPLVAVTGSADRFAVFNRDGKTVCRLAVEKWRVEKAPAGSSTAWCRVRVTPLRGWVDEARSVCFALADAGFAPAASPTLDTALSAVGREVRDYSQKFRLVLDARQSTRDAACAVLRQLFDDLVRNEEGTRNDIDPEFLHDFRVAVRRTRSALSAFHELFDATAIKPHEEAFRDLGRLTGNKRDLDVHLIDFDSHLEQLDAAQRAAMIDLRRILEQRRVDAGKHLARYLKSPAYRAFKRNWSAFLDSGEALGPWAKRPVRAFADRTLWSTYRSILKHGRAIDEKSADDALHDLRKRAKKFRYLLEFFQSLYPVKSMKTAISELKQFQDHLGRFQDCCVQVETLQSLRSGDISEVAAGAIDQLLSGLALQHRYCRETFGERFKRFDRKANRVRYAALFKPVRRVR